MFPFPLHLPKTETAPAWNSEKKVETFPPPWLPVAEKEHLTADTKAAFINSAPDVFAPFIAAEAATLLLGLLSKAARRKDGSQPTGEVKRNHRYTEADGIKGTLLSPTRFLATASSDFLLRLKRVD